jgi:hypothetical protein
VNVGALFVANTQTPELINPSEGPFNDPPPSAQSATMLRRLRTRQPCKALPGLPVQPDLRLLSTGFVTKASTDAGWEGGGPIMNPRR